jgi:phosphoribosylformylglycinamidine cyclo-ligase
MLKTFNAGIGMVVVVAADAVADVTAALRDEGQTVVTLGHISEGQGVTYEGQLW